MNEPEEPDPLIDEIYEIRKQISREHGHDVRRLVAHHAELQKKYAGRLISEPRPPRPGESPSPDLDVLLSKLSTHEEPDPLINEIHEIRREIFAEHGKDPVRLFEHYIEYQKQFTDRLISSPPKKDKPAA